MQHFYKCIGPWLLAIPGYMQPMIHKLNIPESNGSLFGIGKQKKKNNMIAWGVVENVDHNHCHYYFQKKKKKWRDIFRRMMEMENIILSEVTQASKAKKDRGPSNYGSIF